MTNNSLKLFGTDGVRGRANASPMDSETALALGRAVAAVFRDGPHKHRIVIGKDTRLSGYMLETALASGICSMGVEVLLVGPLPTPGIAFITRSMRADAGVVISASHNVYSDNGIKFFNKDGYKLSAAVESKIEALVASDMRGFERSEGSDIGRAQRIDDAAGRYIQFLKDAFPHSLTLDGMRIVVDCANGAAYHIAPAVFAELGAEVIELGTEPDGININEGCGSLHPERMCELVRRIGADAGIALDGDADRIIMCDETGEIVDGDVIMALAAVAMKERGRLAGNTIVATVMSNIALDGVMAEHGIDVVRTRVGDKYVIQAMLAGGYNLGGEQSGHMIFSDHNTTGDGIVAGLKMLSIIRRAEKPFSELTKIFEPYPQVLINVGVNKKADFLTFPKIAALIDSYQKELGERGRLMLRYSETESVARVMVEGPDHGRITDMADDLAGEIDANLGR